VLLSVIFWSSSYRQFLGVGLGLGESQAVFESLTVVR